MMRAFSNLLETLIVTPSRNGKLLALENYFRHTPDPDRGIGLAAIAGRLDMKSVKPAGLRQMVAGRVDEELFRLSYDFVGDLAETIALIWDHDEASTPDAQEKDLRLPEVVRLLDETPRNRVLAVVADLLDHADPSIRFAILKLATGGLRIGVSARMAKQALARFGDVDVAEIEELWHGLEPPFEDLFGWLEGRTDKPVNRGFSPFRPVMLATALDDAAMATLDPADYLAEWKWDGIRVQVTSESDVRRIYTRTGDDISAAFPDILEHMDFHGALDGELLVARRVGDATEIATFSDLQQRLNRKTVSKQMLRDYPAFVRLYDVLDIEGVNLRPEGFAQRRSRLEAFATGLNPARFDLSEMVPFETWPELARLREDLPHPVIEGVMLKHRDSAYVPGRPRGPWFKWKRDPFLIDAVLMYAQRGHGKRSGFYSDYTFGVWAEDGALVPVGKAYFGFTDEELKRIDRFVRENTIDRFGPVRSVRAEEEKGLVLEIAFEGLNRSKRHKSGVAMRFPRVARLRWDKPPREADQLSTLEAMLEPDQGK